MKEKIESNAVSITRIAKENKVGKQKLSRAYKEVLSDYRLYRKIFEEDFENESFVFSENFGENMAIDETGLFNGQLYTIIYNKDKKGKKGSLAAIIKGTKASVISAAVNSKVPVDKRMNIKEITLDLSNSMDWASREIALNAIKTYDRFHVEKLIIEAVQQVRIEYRWKAIEKENQLKKNKDIWRLPRYHNGDSEKQLLVRSRYLLYKRRKDWTTEQRQRAEILFSVFPKIRRAYEYYMEFKNIYRMNRLSAEHYLLNWIKRVKKSGIDVLVTVAKTIENHLGGILNYLENRATNASIENFNRKLKSFLEKLRGVNDKDLFFYRLIKLYA